jgi:hypothetical protein
MLNSGVSDTRKQGKINRGAARKNWKKKDRPPLLFEGEREMRETIYLEPNHEVTVKASGVSEHEKWFAGLDTQTKEYLRNMRAQEILIDAAYRFAQEGKKPRYIDELQGFLNRLWNPTEK